MIEDQEEEKKALNKNRSDDTPRINRGVELLLRNKRRISQPKTFQVKVGKMISFLKQEHIVGELRELAERNFVKMCLKEAFEILNNLK